MRLTPVSRKEFIRRLRHLGWDGPIAGGKHQHMVKGAFQIPIPNPHGGEIGPAMIQTILREIEVSRDEWRNAG